MQYTADIELNVDFPTNHDQVSELVDHLMDGLEVYGGTVTRTLAGRVEVILTVPGDGLRQATSTALAVAHALGYDEPFALTVMPAKEFARRSQMAPVPELLSVSQAAEALSVSRQRVLQLIRGGQLEATKVGDTWVVPRTAVTARAATRQPTEVIS